MDKTRITKANKNNYMPAGLRGRAIKENVDMDELISKNAAIDALYHVDEYNGRSVEAIRNLPFAQPERTCVNCGRTANNGGWYADGRTRCPIEEHYALPKDGFCHLWEKRNITDDDYPERREE